jgi:two-component system, NarL family, nitrate/nitrite response regulator NarL
MSEAIGSLNIAVVEDDPRFRRGLETLFAFTPGFRLVACHGAAEPLVAAAERARDAGAPLPWDLAIMDIQLPGMDGVAAVQRLKAAWPDTPIVMLTVFEEPSTILGAICAGADGYLLKRTPAPELIALIRSVVAGGAPLTAGVARTVLDLLRHSEGPLPGTGLASGAARVDLTEREQEVLRGLVKGLAYKQVGGELGISIDTVRAHIRGIYRKLQVHSVAEAVARAIREQLT